MNKVIDWKDNIHQLNGQISQFNDICTQTMLTPTWTARHIRGAKCLERNALFNEFSAVLQFPYYFGENWDAFEECFNDLDWLTTNNFALFISNMNMVLSNEKKQKESLIQILKNSVTEWQNIGIQLHLLFHYPIDTNEIDLAGNFGSIDKVELGE